MVVHALLLGTESRGLDGESRSYFDSVEAAKAEGERILDTGEYDYFALVEVTIK